MRLIDADALLETLGVTEGCNNCQYSVGKHCFRIGYSTITCKAIANAPTVLPQMEWIPCSERLPSDEDYDETFTVTIQCEHYDGWDDYVTGYADWTPHGWDIQSCYMGQIKVIAWMPLPEPYE